MTHDELCEEVRTRVGEAVIPLRLSLDAYLLLCALLGHASLLAEALIAVKRVTPEEVTKLFAGTCGMAISPTDPLPMPRIIHISGDEPTGQKH